jgi:hypothetical protein
MKLASIATALLSLAATATAAVVPVPEADTAAAFESLDTANATDIAVSLLRPRAKCTLHIRWVSNWSEDAYRRYRVKAWADRGDAYGSSKEMVVEWSNRAGCTYNINTLPGPRTALCSRVLAAFISGGIRSRPHE